MNVDFVTCSLELDNSGKTKGDESPRFCRERGSNILVFIASYINIDFEI